MIPTTVLSNNVEMPLIGLGTTHSGGYYHDAVLHSIKKCGYRLIDTAKRYGVEKQLGIAVKNCSVPREEMFLSTKLWPVDCGDEVYNAFQTSCEKLQTDYLDMYMIHMPQLPDWIVNQKETKEKTWRQMELLYEDGKFGFCFKCFKLAFGEATSYIALKISCNELCKLNLKLPMSISRSKNPQTNFTIITEHVRSIGVSNYSIEDLDELLEFASILPHANQVELHPWFHQADLKNYCDELGILTMGYCPLAKGKYLEDETLCKIASKYQKSPAQICLRWSIQQNVPTVPKSTDCRRLKENTNVFDFELSAEDMNTLNSFSSQNRKVDFKFKLIINLLFQHFQIVDLSNICQKMSLPDGYKLNGRVFGVPEEDETIPKSCSKCAQKQNVPLPVCI